MSTYQPHHLWQLWQREEIDSTMVIGYMLQNLVLQQEAITKLNTSLVQVKQELEQMEQHPKAPAPTKPQRKLTG
jgi:hypothetical protein